MTRNYLAPVAALGLLAAPAWAHHSTAMFDMTKAMTLTGTVKEFQWTNPHSWIQVNVTDARGVTKEWSVESLSTGTLSRQGWRPKSFKPGDKVTVRVYPMKDGSAAGMFVGAILADGKTLGRMEP
jgi:hypothetical protein